MGFAAAIGTCFAKYVTFSGRASRPEYWYFLLFFFLMTVVAGLVDWKLFAAKTYSPETGQLLAADSREPAQAAVTLALFLPHLSAGWRRMQDTGRPGVLAMAPLLLIATAFGILIFGIGVADIFESGGALDILFTRLTLLIVIPTVIVFIVSPLLVLWWLTRPSQPGPNKYGPNPYEVTP